FQLPMRTKPPIASCLPVSSSAATTFAGCYGSNRRELPASQRGCGWLCEIFALTGDASNLVGHASFVPSRDYRSLKERSTVAGTSRVSPWMKLCYCYAQTSLD